MNDFTHQDLLILKPGSPFVPRRVILAMGLAIGLLSGLVFSPELFGSPRGYIVQIHSFKNKTNADRFIKKLSKKGYSPFVVLTQGKDSPWYKVRIGPYPSKKEASQVVRDLRKNQGLKAIVLRAYDSTRKVVESSEEPEAPPSAETGETGSDSSDSIDVVVSRFLIWVQSWQAKDIESYLTFYSNSFKGGGKSMAKWKRSRRNTFQKSGNIQIEVSEVHLKKGENIIEMSFIQHYRSDIVSDVGRKTLVWKKEGADWKIIEEFWKPV